MAAALIIHDLAIGLREQDKVLYRRACQQLAALDPARRADVFMILARSLGAVSEPAMRTPEA